MRMLKNEIMIFDSHFHIIDDRFPLVANQGYLPNNFTCADYLERARKLKIAGGAIVSGSFQAFDQNYLVAAIEDLGPTFVGVYFDVVPAMKAIVSINPDALMFGTDLPSTRADRPFRDEDVNVILDAFDEESARKILYENAVAFYRPQAAM